MVPRDELLVETGRALRDARLARGLTLRDVGTRSNGLFKPTAVAGYERAERAISESVASGIKIRAPPPPPS